MVLKDVLQANKVPLPADFDERLNLVMLGLRRDPGFNAALQKFKEQDGGALKMPAFASKMKANIPATATTPISMAPPMELDSEDWMGPRIKWFLDAITSPYARVMLRGLFMVVFFVSYLEAIPVFGQILSAGLDIVTAGSKAITKTIQRQIPPAMGLLPIPYASLVGMVIAGIYGAIVWPMIAMVAFSRQDFAAAIESFLRAIPPPAGDTIADLFMEANRLGARLDAKRQKLANDITTAISAIVGMIEDVSMKLNQGMSKVNSQINRAAQLKDQAVGKIQEVKNQAQSIQDTVKDQTQSIQDTVNDQTQSIKDTVKNTAIPTDFTSNLKTLSSKIQESAKPRTSFGPTPVGQGRHKRLSTRRRMVHKWTKTRRTKSAKR